MLDDGGEKRAFSLVECPLLIPESSWLETLAMCVVSFAIAMLVTGCYSSEGFSAVMTAGRLRCTAFLRLRAHERESDLLCGRWEETGRNLVSEAVSASRGNWNARKTREELNTAGDIQHANARHANDDPVRTTGMNRSDVF